MTSPINLRSVREQIADRLRTEILADRFDADAPMREVELAERFGVGRGTVRDALLQLTQEGALAYRPNRGVRVGAPAADSFRELLVSIRRQIETHALESCFDDLTDDDRESWREILADLERACGRADVAAIVDADMAFHRSLVRRGGGEELEAIWLPIVVRIRIHYSKHDDYARVHAEHRRIVDAICKGQRKTALNALGRHIF